MNFSTANNHNDYGGNYFWKDGASAQMTMEILFYFYRGMQYKSVQKMSGDWVKNSALGVASAYKGTKF